MDYSKTVTYAQPQALGRLKEALKEHRWGVVSDIDMKATLKEKVGADVENYNILDVCNPKTRRTGPEIEQESRPGDAL